MERAILVQGRWGHAFEPSSHDSLWSNLGLRSPSAEAQTGAGVVENQRICLASRVHKLGSSL